MSNSFKAKANRLATMFFVAKKPVYLPQVNDQGQSIPGTEKFVGYTNGRTYRKVQD